MLPTTSMTRAAVLPCLVVSACAHVSATPTAEAKAAVEATERAFAKSMADRDLAAFTSHLSDEAVFFTGPTPLRGKSAVAQRWAKFFEGEAPFSWAPDTVEVLDSGTLALSAGPVCDPAGALVGRFSSIWRQEQPGVWKIVFDHGEPLDPSRPSSGCPVK